MSIYKSLLKVQSEVGALTKDATNPFFTSKYVTLNAVREAVIPLLSKNNLVLLQPTVVVDGAQYVATTIVDSESGEKVESLTAIVAKNNTDAQQVGSGISYARRYGLMSLLCLAAEDDDGNSAADKQQPAAKSFVAPSTNTSGPKKVSFANKTKPAATTVVSSGDEL